MKVSRHITYSLLGSIIIFYLFSLKDALLFLAGGIFLDIDHYLIYIIKFKNLSLVKAYRYAEDLFKLVIRHPKKYYGLGYFHNIEFLALITIFGFIFNFYFLSLGILFHIILDVLDAVKHRVAGVRELSAIRYFLRRDKKYRL